MSKVESPTALVWKHCPSRYSGTALVVLLKIAGLSAAKDGYAHIRVPVLAQMCGITERRAQQVVETLKKDRILKVKYRKGRSSIFVLDMELINGLPLAVATNEEGAPAQIATTEAATAPTEPAKPTDAKMFAEKLHSSVTKEIRDAQVPEDWPTAWPTEVQPLFDAGHDMERLRKVARFALNNEYWREVHLVNNAAHAFVTNFSTLLEQCENFNGKVAA